MNECCENGYVQQRSDPTQGSNGEMSDPRLQEQPYYLRTTKEPSYRMGELGFGVGPITYTKDEAEFYAAKELGKWTIEPAPVWGEMISRKYGDFYNQAPELPGEEVKS